jgi:hypothetical protein
MSKNSRNIQLFAMLLLLTESIAVSAEWKDQLKEKLESQFTLSKIGIDRIRVTQPGTVLVIRKEGIGGDLATDATFTKSVVQDGNILPPKGFVAVLQDKKTTHMFKPGERVYVWKIAMDDDELALFLVSCETFAVNSKGSTQQTRYKAMLDFKFSKGYLPGADFDQINQAIKNVLITEQDQQASSTKTVSLGQTLAEVEAILGRPDKIINLGPKTVFVYKDMKVVFLDSKVSDVQ